MCAGTNQADRNSAAAVASVDNLPKPHALDVLYECAACPQWLRNRVYEFWRDKRRRAAKPALRRLQAPTPESEANPYLVFRQRAKPSKPLTRRRRETQEESLDKLGAVLENLEHAMKVAAMVRDREAQKRVLVVRRPLQPLCLFLLSARWLALVFVACCDSASAFWRSETHLWDMYVMLAQRCTLSMLAVPLPAHCVCRGHAAVAEGTTMSCPQVPAPCM